MVISIYHVTLISNKVSFGKEADTEQHRPTTLDLMDFIEIKGLLNTTLHGKKLFPPLTFFNVCYFYKTWIYLKAYNIGVQITGAALIAYTTIPVGNWWP